MYFLNEITPMKLMKKQALLPINLEDKKKGSLIYLLGPNYESCINMTKIPMFLNRSLSYQSYYVDKNVSYYINNKNYLQESIDINNSENILYPDKDMDIDLEYYSNIISEICNTNILESEALSSKERKELPDKSFGLPKKRKYPIHDKKHVMLAIKFFNHCDDVDKEELARNINKAIDKLFDDTERKGIHVGKNNGFSVYWQSSDVVNEYSEDISFSKSFKDVKIIVDSLSSDDLLSICDGNFKESPYILYREVIKISDKPVSFIEIYNLPTMKKNTGFIVIASDSNYRRNGYASILLDRAKTWAKDNNIELVYKTKPGNDKSISLGRKYELMDESHLLGFRLPAGYITRYNFDEWTNGNNNVVYIIGSSGDGKTTIAIDMSYIYKAKIISLDSLLYRIRHSKDKVDAHIRWIKQDESYSNAIIDYMNTRMKDIPYSMSWDELNENNYFINIIDDFFNWIESNKKRYKESIIVEGVQLLYLDPAKFVDKPVVIMGISKTQAFLRRVSRDKENHPDKNTFGLIFKHLLNYHNMYKYDRQKDRFVDKYTSSLGHYLVEAEDTLPSTTTNPDNLSDRIEKIPYIPEMKSAEDVLNAIKSFNIIPKQAQKDVSALIFKAADEYGVDIKVTSDNNLYKYNMLRTATDHIESDKESEEVNYRPTFSSNDYEATNEYFRGRNYITFYPDAYLTEDGKYDAQLRKLLYNERLKTNKDVFAIYDKVKEDNPLIKKTFSNLKLYKGLNLFVDLSYYTEVFFKNNFWKADKGIELYFDFVCRLINDARYDQYGYKEKTIFIPIDDWNKNKNVDIWDHRKCINPISMIVRMAKRFPELLQAQLKDFNVIFIGEQTYFRVDFSKFDRSAAMKFITLIKRVINKDVTTDDMNDPDIDSKNVIVATIVDQIETSGKTSVKINNLVGTKKVSEEELKKRKANQVSSSNTTDKKARQDSNKKVEIKEKKAAEKSKEKASEELVDAIAKAAENNTNVDDAINDMDKDTTGRIEAIINQLAEEETEVNKVSAARSSRILKLEKELEKKSLKGSSIKNLIEKSKTADPLPVKKIPIDSINEEWQELTFANFNESYDINADIMAILNSFSQMTSPISVRDVKVENTSTSEDLVETWTAQCEDYKGQRFTLKFDIPLFIDNKFMRLRGNMKTLQGQLILLPIIKTDGDTCQIVSNYNKIFIRRTNTNTGKSNCTSDKIIKTLLKNKFKNIKTVEWDNSKISNKYELPIDYIDISGVFDKIEIKETDKTTVFMFNQEEIRRNYKYDLSQGLPVGYTSKMGKETVLYYKSDTNMTFSQFLLSFLLSFDNEFYDAYSAIKSSSKYTYTTCSILNTNIPTVVVMGYSEGLTAALSKSNIKFQLKEKRDKELETQGYDRIKFNDGFLYFEDTYIGSLLVNGLKECDTDNYSLADINSKSMWVNFLDYFGGRIKADGLDNFYDLMMDPITVNICKEYDLPYDYISALAYANMLLADNKYNKHVDISGNKFRTTEIIAGYTYRALAKSYGEYKNQLKRNPKAIMTIKQSAVIDLVMIDPTMSDASILTPLLEMETANAVTFKGLSGMNSERSYGLDKRTFDDSMLNVLAMSTGFAGNVGMTRQMTINSNIDNNRGHIGKNKKNMGTVNSLCITEALTPFGTTHDDPMRTAMTFIQSSKHAMRVRHASPALITNGADQALPYLTTDIFAHKAKYKGVVKERTDEYIVIEYDNKTTEFVDLRERVEKNSDGGFYVTLKLDSDLKKGDKVKPMDIVAYDKGSYSDSVGAGALAYNMGTLSKVAILVTDEGYEDSCIVSEWLSKAMSSDIVVKKDVVLPPDTNVLSIVKRGQPIQEGETLILFQNTFDEDEMNALVKTLADDEELVSDLGRIPIKSKNTGVVQDIKVYRTIDKEQLSPSLKKIVNQYESEANKLKKVAKGANNESIANTEFGATDKLPATGKLKDTSEAVKIEFYIKYRDDFSVGDKLVVQSALKGVCKDIFPEGQEPYSDFRKEEPIDLFLSTLSVSARMVCSIEVSGGINKVLIELARKVKDIMGISYPMNVHGKDQTFD